MQTRTAKLTLYFICCMTISVYAQQNNTRIVSGHVYAIENNVHKIVLPYASIVILNLPDSAFVKGNTTNKNGDFRIEYTIKENTGYLLKVSYTGMRTQYYELEETSPIQLGDIILADTITSLSEITISAKQAEMQHKKDTTIINTAVYMLPQNAYLQELVKRIPGILYDAENGKLSYNGKIIQEINVNGETFFNKDTQMALNNLPAKFISKIRIYNKQDNKTFRRTNEEYYILDLQTKDEFNNSLLSSIKAGYGTHRKKDFEGQANYFKENGDNLSLLLQTTNKDLNSLYKNNISHSLGMNVRHKFSDKLNISGNINYNYNKSGEQSKNYTEQYLPSENLYSLGEIENVNKNNSLYSSLGIEWEPDKKTYFLFDITYNKDYFNTIANNNTVTLNHPINSTNEDYSKIPEKYKINSSIYDLLSRNKNQSYNWQIFIYRDISKHLRLNFNMLHNPKKSRNEDFTNSNIHYYQTTVNTDMESPSNKSQYIESPLSNKTLNTSLSLTHSIKEDFILTYSYGIDVKKEDSKRNTFDLSNRESSATAINQVPSDYRQNYIDSLSNNSKSKTYIHNIGLQLFYNSQQWNINANITYSPLLRNIHQKTGVASTDTIIHSSDFLSSISTTWNKNKFSISFNYNGMTNQPPLTILLPVLNTSNPLNVIKGNPNLKQSFTHSIGLSMSTTSGIYSSISYQSITNDIAQKNTFDATTGKRESYPININGNWNSNIYLQWNKTFGDFSLNLNENAIYRNQVSLITSSDNIESNHSQTHDINISSKLRLAYRPQWGNMELTGEHYFSQSQNSLQNSKVYSRDYKIIVNGFVNLPKDLQISNNISYTYRNGTAIDKNNKTELLWNLGITWLFLENKSAELSFYWADILKQKKHYIRNVTADSFYEYRAQQISGYILCSFKYNFNIQLRK